MNLRFLNTGFLFNFCPKIILESDSSHFLIKNGVAVNIKPKDDIDYVLTDVLDNTARLKNMKKVAKTLARPNSCRDITMLLEKIQH